MDFTRRPARPVYAGEEVTFRFELETWEDREESRAGRNYDFRISGSGNKFVDFGGSTGGVATHFMEHGMAFEPTARFADPGDYKVEVRPHLGDGKFGGWELLDRFTVEPAKSDVLKVALKTDSAPYSDNAGLWQFIKDVSENLTYKKFAAFAKTNSESFDEYPSYGSLTYDNLHRLSKDFVTESALGNEYSSILGSLSSTSYLSSTSVRSTRSMESTTWDERDNKADAVERSYVSGRAGQTQTAPFPDGIGIGIGKPYPMKLVPFVELIYVYWLEEAMLFQSLNRILARFQNRRAPGGRDPLSRLAVSPLLPLRGLLWGLSEAEKDRLSLRRRAAEYEYQYGLQLIGRAIPPSDMLVERRTQFLQAFHGLLNACHHFYRQDSDKTVDADAFPLLSNLRELHLVLAHGANNQFADASLAARIETLDVQWVLAQPEMREFLGGRTMVPYDEEWMDRVDSMKSMQGWSDASVTHFYDLAYHGEQLLLTVRHGQWNSSNAEEDDAKNWARTWKASVQRYIHAYRAVTGVDLSERVDTTMPSTLLQRQLARNLVRY